MTELESTYDSTGDGYVYAVERDNTPQCLFLTHEAAEAYIIRLLQSEPYKTRKPDYVVVKWRVRSS